MRGMGLVQPPCLCRCAGCELKGGVMFLHGWVSTCIWQASGEAESNLPTCCWKVSAPNQCSSGSQGEQNTDSSYPSYLLNQGCGEKGCQKAGKDLLQKENNRKGTLWKKSLFKRKRMKWKIPSGSTGFTHQLSSAVSSGGYFSFLYALCCF